VTIAAGQTTTISLGLQPAGTAAATVQWSARGQGLMVAPSDGAFRLTASAAAGQSGRTGCALTPPAAQMLTIIASTVPGTYVLDIDLKTASGQTLPPVVLDVDVTS
jgi:hypothetical protein